MKKASGIEVFTFMLQSAMQLTGAEVPEHAVSSSGQEREDA